LWGERGWGEGSAVSIFPYGGIFKWFKDILQDFEVVVKSLIV